jgi:hypothetical protein
VTVRTDARVYPVAPRRPTDALELPLEEAIMSYARGLAAENKSSQTIERVLGDAGLPDERAQVLGGRRIRSSFRSWPCPRSLSLA